MLFFLSLVLITSYVLRLIIIKKSYLNSDNWSDWGINNLQGIGSPVFDKLEDELAKAMLSLPASKGFEIGSGFAGKESFLFNTRLVGTAHNRLGYAAYFTT